MAPGTFDVQCISGADVGFPPIKTRLYYMHACHNNNVCMDIIRIKCML